MKSLARSYIYWPNVDDDAAQFVRQCTACAEAGKSPTKATLESWPLAVKPWQRVHVDFADPIDGYYYFVIVDAYSTQFTSVQFQQYCSENGIAHLRTAPYHPQSNGQTERFVAWSQEAQ